MRHDDLGLHRKTLDHYMLFRAPRRAWEDFSAYTNSTRKDSRSHWKFDRMHWTRPTQQQNHTLSPALAFVSTPTIHPRPKCLTLFSSFTVWMACDVHWSDKSRSILIQTDLTFYNWSPLTDEFSRSATMGFKNSLS